MQGREDWEARLDSRLSRALRPPQLGPGFRRRLRAEIVRRERQPMWHAVPDVLHLVGCTVTVLTCAAVLPVDRSVTLQVGVAMTLASYVAMTAVRSVLEDA